MPLIRGGRLAAILDALHVGEVVFDRPPTVPQTNLEIMLYGDRWAMAGAESDRRLEWAPATTPESVTDDLAMLTQSAAWLEDAG